MSKFEINEVTELTLIKVNELENGKEVRMKMDIPHEIKKEHDLTNYDVTAFFFNDGEKPVFVYDNNIQETAPIDFSFYAQGEIIEFAEQHI